MKSSINCENLIKQFEGLRLKIYDDGYGVKTIGYGHTGKNLPENISETKAKEYLKLDIAKAEKQVNKYNYPYTQNQFDALVSFAFNVGSIDQITANGTRTLNEVKEKIKLYIYAGGKVSNGLVKRRKAEYDLFCKNDKDEDVRNYNYKIAGSYSLSKNFAVKEFIAKSSPLRELYENETYTIVKIDDKLVSILQKIRDHYGKPIIITSGYRPLEYNKSVNGATASLHTEGRAADIRINGITPKSLSKYCQTIGVKGIGIYKDFVHIDTRENKYYWNG